jgi:hypothetical protein
MLGTIEDVEQGHSESTEVIPVSYDHPSLVAANLHGKCTMAGSGYIF